LFFGFYLGADPAHARIIAPVKDVKPTRMSNRQECQIDKDVNHTVAQTQPWGKAKATKNRWHRERRLLPT
jgi:hypothetical protein